MGWGFRRFQKGVRSTEFTFLTDPYVMMGTRFVVAMCNLHGHVGVYRTDSISPRAKPHNAGCMGCKIAYRELHNKMTSWEEVH